MSAPIQQLKTLINLWQKCQAKISAPEANEVCHEKTDLKVFVVVIPKEGWVRVAAPILLLV